MDFPKSVPNAGLINGQFVDENVGTGQPGSLIPAEWGNLVTHEMLNVIKAAGLVPAETVDNQLDAAINKKITSGIPAFATQVEAEAGTSATKSMSPMRVFQAIAKVVIQATEAVRGLARIASTAQIDVGTDDTSIVTPLKLRSAYGLGDSVFVTNLNNAAVGFFYSPPEAANSPGLGICVGETRGASGTAARTQTCIDVSTGTAYKRVYAGGAWGSWGSDLVPQATEAVLGGAPIATQGQVNAGVNDSSIVTPKKLKVAIAALVDGSPAALDTLKELATALGNDPNFATTMATSLGERVKTSELKDAFGLGNSVLVTNLNNAPVGFFYSAPGATNNPGPGICMGETRGSDGTGSKTQWCIDVSDASMYKRVYLGGTWRPWDKLLGGSVAVSDLNGAPFGFFFAAPGATNSPPNSAGILHGHTYANAGTASGGQVCMDVSGGAMYKRVYTGSSWSAWDKTIDSSNQFGGASQAWQNVSASRTVNVTYTNNTGNPISVAATLVNAAGGSGYFQVGGVKVSQLGTSSGGSVTSSIFVVVPPGATYGTVSTSSIAYWSELR